MVEAKSIDMRPHPRLLGCHGIPFPQNQQFYYEEETSAKRRKHSEKTRMDKEKALDAETAATIQSTMNLAKSEPSTQSSVALPMPSRSPLPDSTEPLVKSKALATLRKTHSEWDRKKREFLSMVASSRRCDATCDSKFESLLQQQIDAGTLLDAELLSMELDHAQATPKPDAEIAAKCTKLVDTMKTGQKYMSALKTLLKVAPS